MLTYHQLGSVSFIREQLHKRYLSHQSLKLAWKWLIYNLFKSPRGQWVNLDFAVKILDPTVCNSIQVWINMKNNGGQSYPMIQSLSNPFPEIYTLLVSPLQPKCVKANNLPPRTVPIHLIRWLCIVPTSTTRFASDLGYIVAKILIRFCKENTFYEQWHQIP